VIATTNEIAKILVIRDMPQLHLSIRTLVKESVGARIVPALCTITVEVVWRFVVFGSSPRITGA
jgi:hypothetical protein